MVQRKPGRGAMTSSVSCSDKIARWNVVGTQGQSMLELLKFNVFEISQKYFHEYHTLNLTLLIVIFDW